MILKKFLLEYYHFTRVYWFLLYNKVNQLYMYTYIASLLYLPPTPTPPPWVTTEPWAERPVLYSRLPLAVCFTHGKCVNADLTVRPTFPRPYPHSHMAILCISIPALELSSSLPFFQIPHMCINTWYLFLFLTCFTLYDTLGPRSFFMWGHFFSLGGFFVSVIIRVWN